MLCLLEIERIRIVEKLLRCKNEFGDFLVNTNAMIQVLHPDVTVHQTPATCGVARFVPSFDAAGVRMKQCILSEKADCTPMWVCSNNDDRNCNAFSPTTRKSSRSCKTSN